MNDQAKALLFVAALFGGCGFTGGRMTAPEPAAEVRIVRIPARPLTAPSVQARKIEPPPFVLPPIKQPAPIASTPAPTTVVEEKPQPAAQPRPKVEDKPKSKLQPKTQPKPRTTLRSALPSCAVVKREYERMSMAERWAAYRKATPEQIAHGKRCLGF